MKEKVFDPEKSFFDLSVVRWTLRVIIFTSLLMSGVIIFCNGLTLDLSYHGFNNFISIFKLPIGVLATAIPIIAVFATNHRSEQTKKQIEVANSQNNFINYYKHMDEFEKHLEQIKSEHHSVSNTRRLYNALYKSSKHGDYSINQELTEEVKTQINKIYGFLSELSASDESRFQVSKVQQIDQVFRKVFHKLFIQDKKGYGSFPVCPPTEEYPGSQIYKSTHDNVYAWLSYLRLRLKFLFDVLQFDTEEIDDIFIKYDSLSLDLELSQRSWEKAQLEGEPIKTSLFIEATQTQ